MGFDLLLEETGDESFHFQFRRKVIAAVAGNELDLDGIDASEELEGLGGGAFRNLQFALDGIEREGGFLGEEQAVDLGVGLGQAEDVGGADEPVDEVDLPVFQRGRGAVGRWDGLWQEVLRYKSVKVGRFESIKVGPRLLPHRRDTLGKRY